MSASVVEERLAAAPHMAGASFRLAVEPDGLGVVVFDTPGEKVNKYSADVLRELDALLDGLAKRTDLKALLLVSSKPDIFIAGADVNEIASASPDRVAEGVRFGQMVFGKLASLPYPTVAAIDGACVGGGCETVLAMDWRLASDSRKTSIGLPEIRLGILPAWGGCSRLPRVVGLAGALDIILAGKTVDGKRAKRIGLVDEVIPQAILPEEAKKFARSKFGTSKRSNAARDGGPLRARPATLREKVLESAGREIVFSKAKAAVLKETKGHYPAPLEALETIRKGFGAPLASGLSAEVEGVSKLVGTPVMKNLVNLFFRMEEVKKESGAGRSVTPRSVRRIGVLGAGVMGGGIAQLAADRGYPARMKDIRAEPLAGGFAQAARIWQERLRKRRMTKGEFAAKMALLSGTLDYSGFATCEVTIEAVLEKLAVKKAVLGEWEGVVPGTAVFASNTSTLPITSIASEARHPERVVGMHFFNPVHRMPLVEVIYGEKTAPEVTATIFDLARRMGKTPVVVKDGPGFLVNRILAPYLGEAVRLLLEGAAPGAVDRAIRAFGMPVGPFELLDDVGIDVATKAAETLSAAWPDRMPIDPAFEKMIGAKRLGRKAGKGFYLYAGDHRKGPDPAVYAELGLSSPSMTLPPSEIERRLLFPMVNEAAFCLADGIVGSPAKLDLAMIFGTGFPPFRGGLCAWADTLGVGAVVEGLEKLAASKGPRFAPAPLLLDLARTGKKFTNPES